VTATLFVPERLIKMREKAKTEADVEKLPVPAGWRLLIMPYEPPSTTKGGIEIPDLVLERERLATVVGCVLAIGPDAYSDEKRYPNGPWCKKNDWVIFARYAGSRLKIEGGELRILNEDEVLGTIDDPTYLVHT
jgi:chaperonin GroES